MDTTTNLDFLQGMSESKDFDLKEMFKNTEQSWVDLMKDILSFSNSEGGRLIYGIEDKTKAIVGVDKTTKGSLSELKNIKQKIDKYIGHDIGLDCNIIERVGLEILIITIHPSKNSILSFSKDGAVKQPSGQEKIAFHAGQVMIRGDGRNEHLTISNEKRLLNKLFKNERERILNGITKIVSNPDTYRVVDGTSVDAKKMTIAQDDPDATKITIDLNATGHLWDLNLATMEVIRGLRCPQMSVSTREIASYLIESRLRPASQITKGELFLLCSKYSDLPKYYLLDEIKEFDFSDTAIIKRFTDTKTMDEKSSLIISLKVVNPDLAKVLTKLLKPEEARSRPKLGQHSVKQEEGDHSCGFLTETPDPAIALDHIYNYLRLLRDNPGSISYEAQRRTIAIDYRRFQGMRLVK